ncbi:hypothetical protein EV426DRAFT_717794 [Tirmania nivea]|nr:hypothetical protein EV426DRAFT_717794 [Tirmania nivea]
MDGQVPDFDILANSMRASANGMQQAATELPNLPVINVAAQLNRLVGEIGDLRMGHEGFTDTNNFARIMNSKITSDTTPLEPLLGRDGKEIPNFLETSADIHDMDSAAVNNLLNSLGLPLGGRIEVRKNRIRRHIGLTVL